MGTPGVKEVNQTHTDIHTLDQSKLPTTIKELHMLVKVRSMSWGGSSLSGCHKFCGLERS